MTASFSVLPKSWPEYSYFTFYANFTALHVTHSIGWRRGHENFKDTLKKWTFKFHQILKCESTELLFSSMPNILLSSPFISGISMSLSKDYRQIVCKISWECKQNTNAFENWQIVPIEQIIKKHTLEFRITVLARRLNFGAFST